MAGTESTCTSVRNGGGEGGHGVGEHEGCVVTTNRAAWFGCDNSGREK